MHEKNTKASAESWKCKPFDDFVKVDCNISLTKEEFENLSIGHIPESMEDHWFMYCDDNSINYFRSWTGIQIFKGYYKFENDLYNIYMLEINNNKEEWREDDINNSIKLFHDFVMFNSKNYK